MFWRVRSFWVATGAACYVALAAARATTGGLAVLALLGLPIGLAVIWSFTVPPARGEDRVETEARSAARVCATGAALLLAARTGPPSATFIALGNLGAALSAMSSLVALARVASLGGLLSPPAATRRLDAAAFIALPWTIAVALPTWSAAARVRVFDSLAIDYATVAASIGSLGIQVAAAARVRALRRLELGAGDRAWAALCFALTALAIGAGAAFVGVLPSERLLPIASVVASTCVTIAVVTPEPTQLARALRITLALATLCAPVALFAVWVATRASPEHAGAAVFVAAAAIAVGGLAAPLVARRFAPEGERWLAAFDAATRSAMNPDPDAALESALLALRETAGRIFQAPPKRPIGEIPLKRRSRRPIPLYPEPGLPEAAALYRLGADDVVTVDRAGYVQVQKALVPERLVDLTDGEPERVLSTEVARAVEVRRPDVRPLVAWLDQRAIAACAVVRDDMGAVGLLTIPRGLRVSPLTLEEVRALRALSDRLGAVLGVSAMLARSHQRELTSRVEAERARRAIDELSSTMARNTDRAEALARAIERPARVASYSPAARVALEELERLAVTPRAVVLQTAPGVDALAWAVLVHLASPRRAGVLVVVDGTNPVEHDLMRWREERSPLLVSAGGTLVVLDAHALPEPVQSYIAAAVREDHRIVATVASPMAELVAAGRISPRLAERLGDAIVALPTLAARGEDLRALALDTLSRFGVRLLGRPLGLDAHALARLGDHAWPGNDAELSSVLLNAALVAEGDLVGTRELEAIGFVPRDNVSPPRIDAGPIPINRRRSRR